MDYHGIKRIGGRGYENHYVIRRKKRRGDVAFFLLLPFFGAAVYLIASALFHTLVLPQPEAVFSLLF